MMIYQVISLGINIARWGLGVGGPACLSETQKSRGQQRRNGAPAPPWFEAKTSYDVVAVTSKLLIAEVEFDYEDD